MNNGDVVKPRRALISVSDKAGLEALGAALAKQGVEIISTGGSARCLRQAGLTVLDVADYTGFPELLDGRVKTLHPKVHGGILGKRHDPAHQSAMADHGIAPIDVVVVNLYPFVETLRAKADEETCIENIDIGGPALIRAAAKNHSDVTVLTDPSDYDGFLEALQEGEGGVPLSLRRRLAAKAFAHTAAYDAAIADWMAGMKETGPPQRLTIAGRLVQALRYGENPHQAAAFYRAESEPDGTPPGVASARQLQGKALSYNNLNDTDAAYELVAEFQEPAFPSPACAIIKHANPCGVALGETLLEAYQRALATDPVSAFGGIIAVNRPLDAATAQEIVKLFAEVIIAPAIEPAAVDLLAEKKNLRVLDAGGLPDPKLVGRSIKSVAGGLLVQDRDAGVVELSDLKVVTKRRPSLAEMDDLLFAFRVAKHVKSNAIVYAKDGATVGIGAGQMSRVDSARLGADKAREMGEAAEEAVLRTLGSVVASDAFFPFADGLQALAEAGARAVIQPGGSMRDEEVIAAADQAGLAMVFTGMRHFRH